MTGDDMEAQVVAAAVVDWRIGAVKIGQSDGNNLYINYNIFTLLSYFKCISIILFSWYGLFF